MEFQKLWADGPLFAQAEHFRLGTDCVLLSDFVKLNRVRRGIDLGCASGAIALLLLCRKESLHMTGLELQADAVAIARENMEVNGFSSRSQLLCGDIRCHRELFGSGSFDLVVSNPPYFAPGRGLSSPDADKAAMRQECATVEELCAAAAPLLRHGGRFCVVYRPERLYELMCAMDSAGLAPKRLRFVQGRAEIAPCLVLLEGRKGGRAGLRIEPPLILNDDTMRSTAEWRRITHWEDGEKA